MGKSEKLSQSDQRGFPHIFYKRYAQYFSEIVHMEWFTQSGLLRELNFSDCCKRLILCKQFLKDFKKNNACMVDI